MSRFYAELKDPATFLGFDRQTLTYKTDVPEREWAFLKHVLEGKPSGTKFSAYRAVDASDVPEDGATPTSTRKKKVYVNAEDLKTGEIFPITHSAIVLQGNVYVIVGRGHAIEGRFGKIQTLLDEEKNLWAMKLIIQRPERVFQENLALEIELGEKLSFLSDVGRKRSIDDPLHEKQRILLMRYYAMDLFDFIKSRFTYLSFSGNPAEVSSILTFEYEIFLILLEVCVQAFYLHTKNVVHTDIKFENILLRFNLGNGQITARLGDFGMCKKLDPEKKIFIDNRSHRGQSERNRMKMIAPEICKTGARYSPSVDVYAMGGLFIQIAGEVQNRMQQLQLPVSRELLESRGILLYVAKLMRDENPLLRPPLAKVTHVLYRHLSQDAFAGLRNQTLFNKYAESIKLRLRSGDLSNTLPHTFDFSLLAPKMMSSASN